MNARFSCSAAFLIATLLCSGCGRTKDPNPTAREVLPDATTEGASEAVMEISDQEAHDFAIQWALAASTGDTAKARQLIDWEAILNRSMDGLISDEGFRKGFLTGATRSSNSLVTTIAKATAGTGSYELVDTVHRDGEQHAVFRLYGDDDNLNYHDIRLQRKNGQIVGDEIFIAATGEAFSDTLRAMVAAAATSQQSLTGRLTGQAQAELRRLEAQKEMNLAVQSGNSQEALKIYDSLPADLKKTKLPMLLRINAIPIEDEVAYKTAVDEYIAQFPSDASVGLISMEAAMIRQDTKMLHKAYQSLSNWTGGDGFLDMMIAAVLANMGTIEQAKEIAAKVPDLADVDENVCHFRLTYAMGISDHPETLRLLRILRDDFGYEFNDLRGVEEYQAFCESESFQQWLSDD